MSDKIREITAARAAARSGMADAIAPLFSLAVTGDLRAVMAVGIRSNGAVMIEADHTGNDLDRLALLGLLEEAKRKLLSDKGFQ